ncbi:ABC transporter ATP-binding protein [Paenibacillus albiflavus]|uniref:ABC transporter ATP-binding protein n=1 Tax=Paenibacillus albiflavus TaxID=2545760 RepID=A0A4R4E6W6_9BACL|nr:ABC transporter ATP-binding protein [Paenibacillus albiflavus]TCZ73771.1 ABC transporter ATP-binding protein [Paenibacillus albiflavus]
MIKLSHITKAYDSHVVLNDISFNIQQGEFIGLIGPNGSGKSTLLRMLSGVERVDQGVVELRGKRVHEYPRKEIARWLAVLEQEALPSLGFTTREIVEMGRYPFQNWLGDDSNNGHQLVDRIMEHLQLQDIEDRKIDTLSGGQRQRVALGRVMAQEPLLLLLDEPTTYLDIAYQIQMMDYIHQWQVECGLTVVAVLHDLNLAAQYCTRLMMVSKGQIVADGKPEEIISPELIKQVYGTEPIVLKHPTSGVPQILLQPTGLNGM